MNSEPNPKWNAEAKAVVEKYLMTGETLIWAGKPHRNWKKQGKAFQPVFGIIFCCFIFILISVMASGHGQPSLSSSPDGSIHQGEKMSEKAHSPSLPVAIFFTALASIFFGFWLYMMFRIVGGRQLINFFSLSTTTYGLTDNR